MTTVDAAQKRRRGTIEMKSIPAQDANVEEKKKVVGRNVVIPWMNDDEQCPIGQ